MRDACAVILRAATGLRRHRDCSSSKPQAIILSLPVLLVCSRSAISVFSMLCYYYLREHAGGGVRKVKEQQHIADNDRSSRKSWKVDSTNSTVPNKDLTQR